MQIRTETSRANGTRASSVRTRTRAGTSAGTSAVSRDGTTKQKATGTEAVTHLEVTSL